jgi:glutathione S-transferase
MFVIKEQGSISDQILDANKKVWDENIVQEFLKDLKTKKFICGDNFTGADIMVNFYRN